MARDKNSGRKAIGEVPGAMRPLFVGVFFTFAPIGCLVAMAHAPPAGWVYGALMAVVSGLIAVGWSYTFVTGRFWLLAAIVPAQMVLPPVLFWAFSRIGVMGIGMGMTPQARTIVLGVMAVALMVVGFVLSMRVVSRVEAHSVRARTELDVARRMHETIVPPISLRAGDIEVFGRSEPSSEMGGDLIDAVARDGQVDVFLADVSGHGVGAGVVMGMVKSSIRTLMRSRGSLEGLVTDLNAVLADLITSEMFATFACVRLRSGGAAEYALAGHLPIWHFIAATGEIRDLPNDRLPLGIDAAEQYITGRAPVARGDTLAMITDGLVEVLDPAGRQLGMGELREMFRSNARESLPALHGALIGAARAHGAQADDQSVVLIRVG